MKRFTTSLPYFSEPIFAQRAEYLWPAYHSYKLGSLIYEMHAFFSIIAAARRTGLLLLDSISKSNLLACCALSFLPRSYRPMIVMHGEMWQPNEGLRSVIERVIVRTADRAISRYIVLSSEEIEVFPRIWGVAPSKVRCCPFFFTLKENERLLPAPSSDFVFSGGNSHRDYEPLIEAAKRLPNIRFFIATRLLEGRRDLPSNLEARSVDHREFVFKLRSSTAVVVPIRKGLERSAGQQTYLNAMILRKPVVVTPAFGVLDHVSNKETGLVVDGSIDSLVEALQWILDPSNSEAVAEMSHRAMRAATRFGFENHVQCILAVLDELYASAEGRG